MTSLHGRIDKILVDLHAEPIFRDIHNGCEIPLLTDYALRQLPAEFNSSPPPKLVDGKDLVPLFANADFYTVYCIDLESSMPSIRSSRGRLMPSWLLGDNSRSICLN